MVSKIELNNLKFYAFHGVLPQEMLVGNNFLINLTLTAPIEKAVSSDDLDDTINYATVYHLIEKEMIIPSKLLEHVAGRILRSLKTHFPQLEEIELVVSKLNPPIGGEADRASVILKETYDTV
ncbi:MAG: dihydroneopterin aldolase [Tannerellaceae bacterium]|jgi:dihydroneopterin aldolase|nr:dihydroneopterin aldolase [Tannerellaceae bacterium]